MSERYQNYFEKPSRGRNYDNTSDVVTLGYVDPLSRIEQFIEAGQRIEAIRNGELELENENEFWKNDNATPPTLNKWSEMETGFSEIERIKFQIEQRTLIAQKLKDQITAIRKERRNGKKQPEKKILQSLPVQREKKKIREIQKEYE